MHLCYEEADLYRESLRGLEERFGFRGVTSLVLGAQNLMQQVGADARRGGGCPTLGALAPASAGRFPASYSVSPWAAPKARSKNLQIFS